MTDVTIQLTATPSESGFDILAITAGIAKGHNITFSTDVLLSAMTLYDNVPVFIDHPAIGDAHSVRNLAGTLHAPSWNEEKAGIQATLIPAGPSADVLIAIRDAALSNSAIMQAVGFSTVLNLKLDRNRNVTKINDIRSTDVVIDPARGGQFLSALQSSALTQGEETMSDNVETALSDQEQAAIKLQEANAKIMADMQLQSEKANSVLLQMSQNLLNTSLNASKLPAASQAVIRKQFEGKVFEPSELETALSEKRAELSEIVSGNLVQGPGRTSNMITTDDQIRAAMDDLMNAPRDPGMENVAPARLSGIREAYLMLTGDYNLHGGYHSENVQLATTADFTGLVKNALNKVVKATFNSAEGYLWWKKIVKIEHFNSLNDITGILTGTVGLLNTVAEQGEYPEIAIGDSPEVASFVKKGGYIPLTLELIDRDETRKLRAYPRELAMAAVRTLSSRIADVFTSNSAAGPAMADTGALFNATAVTTKGGHKNLLTTALGTDYTAWEAVAAAMYNQPMLVKQDTGYYGTGSKLGVDPKYCLVPRALRGQAASLFVPRWASQTNAIEPSGITSWGGMVEVLTVPEWTDTTDWAAVADPNVAPCIIVGERFGLEPEIFTAGRETDAAVFMNDEHRIKVRTFNAVLVQDFRGLHKSNV